jgi:hypothetical protein
MLGEVDLWRRLEEAIVAEINARCDGIVSGNLDTLERYRFETGMVRGLQWVLDRARDLIATTTSGAGEHGENRQEDEHAG